MDNDNPFALTPEFTALVQSVISSASVKASAPTVAPADPLAAARAATLKQFRGLNDEQRQAAIERMRAARK